MVLDDPSSGKTGTGSAAAVVGMRPLEAEAEAGGKTKKKNRPSKAKRMSLRKAAVGGKAQGEDETQGRGGERGEDGGDEEEMMMNMV